MGSHEETSRNVTFLRTLSGNHAQRVSLACVSGLVVAAMVLALAPPLKAEDNEWSVGLTPQVWFSHIQNNGFSPPPPLVIPSGVATNPHQFTVTSRPESALDPQWGAQFALQKERWTFGVAFQYVSFETRNDIATSSNSVTGLIVPSLKSVTDSATPGQKITQERVDSDRFDLDLVLTYLFPDIVEHRLDVNAGLGFKFIYASATRQFFNGVLPGAAPGPNPQQYLYAQCNNENLTGCRLVDTVPVDDRYYGATIPLNLSFYLTTDRKWIVPLNATPFIGAETRNDHNVIYAIQPGGPLGFKAKPLDGTTVAYGATADVGIRYVSANGVALYGGFRVQFLEGHEQYLAWGPVVNLSVRFGK